jgi:transcriptional regulator with XRE-family HTH domain
MSVDTGSEIREFLTSRRAKITPDQVDLPVYGDNRRVPGLRREEVALLAGVSVDYYTRLERGNLSGVSESVLEALARALQLDEAERAHLFDLARAAGTTARTRRRPTKQRVRPSVQHILDAITGAPALVQNGRLDILAANPLGRALYSEMYVDPVRPVNHARFIFLNPRAKPAGTHTTVVCQTSSESCRRKARRSVPDGPRTTSASTRPASSIFTTRSSAISA